MGRGVSLSCGGVANLSEAGMDGIGAGSSLTVNQDRERYMNIGGVLQNPEDPGPRRHGSQGRRHCPSVLSLATYTPPDVGPPFLRIDDVRCVEHPGSFHTPL